MASAPDTLRLGWLRAAGLSPTGAVVPLPWLLAGTLTWPLAHAHRVLHAWSDWIAAQPEPPATSVRVRRRPGGAATVAVEVALPGEPWVAGARLAPLRALAPEQDTVGVAPPELGLPLLAAVPAGLEPVTARVRLRTLDAGAIDAFVAAAGPNAALPLLTAELHHLGGAFALTAVAAAADGDEAERVAIALARLERALAPWSA